MDKKQYTFLLEHPEQISSLHTRELKAVLDHYPFLQSARAMHLKGLKNEDSPYYNQALKRTAAQTQDRNILFDFITSPLFQQRDIGQKIRQQEDVIHTIEVIEAHDVSQQVEEEELGKANAVLDPHFFMPKKEDGDETKGEEYPDTLKQGSPLEFTKNETHSFAEWLKITSAEPIDRSAAKPENEQRQTADPERRRRIKLIDKFITSNPKIKVKPIDEAKKITFDDKDIPSESLMTETLARVYVEQKNYKKAKQAYKILSLKYPEKSGFFADQIRAVEQLQDPKNQ